MKQSVFMMRGAAFTFRTKSVIHKMRSDDKTNCQYKKENFHGRKKLFGDKKNKSSKKYHSRTIRMMMFDKSMIKRICSNKKRNGNHAPFKTLVVNNIYSKQWQYRNQYRQQSTVNGTGYRSENTQSVPV